MTFLLIFHNLVADHPESYCIRGDNVYVTGLGAPPVIAPLYRDLPVVMISGILEKLFAVNEIQRKYCTPLLDPNNVGALLEELQNIGCDITATQENKGDRQKGIAGARRNNIERGKEIEPDRSPASEGVSG
jgi:hypothetical protein